MIYASRAARERKTSFVGVSGAIHIRYQVFSSRNQMSNRSELSKLTHEVPSKAFGNVNSTQSRRDRALRRSSD
jgi:hypothetical protein